MKSITDELKELEQWVQTQEFHDSDIEYINKIYARIYEITNPATVDFVEKHLSDARVDKSHLNQCIDALMDMARTAEQKDKIKNLRKKEIAQKIHAALYGKTAVISFSGGRTSAYMVYLIEQMRKSGEWQGNVEYIFMDTGAEHHKTYKFIKKCVDHFGINLTCLQGDFEQPIGVGHSYKVVPIDSLKHDMINGPFGRLMAKYGVPTVASAWCTTRMKEEVFQKYCNDKYGKGNYVTWLGIRFDEPSRLVGLLEYRKLKSAGLSDIFIARCFADAVQSDGLLCESLLIKEIALRKKSDGLNYLASLVEDEKSDIIDFWQEMPFNLEIDEHLGNCVFCFKKSINKVALAARDEPELAAHFIDAIGKANNRLNEGSEIPKGVMFRNNNSLQSIIAKFELHSRDDIADTIRSMKRKESGGCTESCEAFGCQLDLFNQPA